MPSSIAKLLPVLETEVSLVPKIAKRSLDNTYYIKDPTRKNREILKGKEDSTGILDYLSRDLVKYINSLNKYPEAYNIGFSNSNYNLRPELGYKIELPTYYRWVLIPCKDITFNNFDKNMVRAYPDEMLYKIIKEEELHINRETISSLVIENGNTRVYEGLGGIMICTAAQVINTPLINKKENIGFKNHLENSKHVALIASDIYHVLK